MQQTVSGADYGRHKLPVSLVRQGVVMVRAAAEEVQSHSHYATPCANAGNTRCTHHAVSSPVSSGAGPLVPRIIDMTGSLSTTAVKHVQAFWDCHRHSDPCSTPACSTLGSQDCRLLLLVRSSS